MLERQRNQVLNESLVREGMIPLRIMLVNGVSKLRAPYEIAPFDTATLSQITPQIARISLVDEGGTFQRDLFISQSRKKKIITMSGYELEERIHVAAWNDVESRREEDEKIGVVRQIDLEHVQGYERALLRHHARMQGTQIDPLSVSDAEEIYKAIIYTIPR